MAYKRTYLRFADIKPDANGKVHFIVPMRTYVQNDAESIVAGPGAHIAGMQTPALYQVHAFEPADCPFCDSADAHVSSASAQALRSVSPESAERLRELAGIAAELDEVTRQRDKIVERRNALLRDLYPTVGQTTLARVVALTHGAVYKIVRHDSNRTVTDTTGVSAHEPNRRTSGTP